MKCPKCGKELFDPSKSFGQITKQGILFCEDCQEIYEVKPILSTAEKLIVIKTDMKEMPKGCADCLKCEYKFVVGKNLCVDYPQGGYMSNKPLTRPEWCPLMEIKESK